MSRLRNWFSTAAVGGHIPRDERPKAKSVVLSCSVCSWSIVAPVGQAIASLEAHDAIAHGPEASDE